MILVDGQSDYYSYTYIFLTRCRYLMVILYKAEL